MYIFLTLNLLSKWFYLNFKIYFYQNIIKKRIDITKDKIDLINRAKKYDEKVKKLFQENT